MNVGPGTRGTPLLLAHCGSFDPDRSTARQRLDEALGPELAHRLVYALCAGAPVRANGPAALRARPVFAA